MLNGKQTFDNEAGEFAWPYTYLSSSTPGTPRDFTKSKESFLTQLKVIRDMGMKNVKIAYLFSWNWNGIGLDAAKKQGYSYTDEDGGDKATAGPYAGQALVPDPTLLQWAITQAHDQGFRVTVYPSRAQAQEGGADVGDAQNPVSKFKLTAIQHGWDYIVKRFAGTGVIWESWNEPTNSGSWTYDKAGDEGQPSSEEWRGWTALNSYLQESVHRNDPRSPFVYGNFSSPLGDRKSFFDALKNFDTDGDGTPDANLLANVDAVSSHAYIGYPQDQLKRNTPQGTGTGLPALDSESGYPVGTVSWVSGHKYTERDQADFLAQKLLFNNISGVSMTLLYRTELEFNILRTGSETDKLTPRSPADPTKLDTADGYTRLPAVATLKHLITGLEGYTYQKLVPVTVDGRTYSAADQYTPGKGAGSSVFAALFSKGDQEKIVYWRTTTTGTDAGTTDAQVQYGDQSIDVKASTTPQMFTGAVQNQTTFTQFKGFGTSADDVSAETVQAHGGGVLAYNGAYYWVGQGKSPLVGDGKTPDPDGTVGNDKQFTALNLYRSTDLVHWRFVHAILTPNSASFLKQAKVERPSLLFNRKTGRFVLWAHYEGLVGYTQSKTLVATSDTIGGDYTPTGDPFQPKVQQSDGTVAPVAVRDQSVFTDPDTGSAYLFTNASDTYIFKLDDDFTNVVPSKSYAIPQLDNREAPAVFKQNGTYYVMASEKDYWNSTHSHYATSTNLEDPKSWSDQKPLGDWSKDRSQPTRAFSYPKADGTTGNMYIGDTWVPLGSDGMPVHLSTTDLTKVNIETARYTWMPAVVGDDGALSLDYNKQWAPDPAAQLVASAAPTVTGDAKVGATLSAQAPGGWTDSLTGASLAPAVSYQWYANGQAISGATRATLSVDGTVAGQRITVRVTAKEFGYTDSTLVSPQTAVVTGGYRVSGAIATKWTSTRSTMGAPTAPMARGINGGYYQYFANGVITYTGATKAHAVYGHAGARWTSLGAGYALEHLSYAKSDGGDDVSFARGEIIYNPGRARAFVLEGGIWNRYRAIGGSRAVGLPKSDMVAGRGGGVKKMNWFEKGAITWGNGIHAVKGAIYRTWTYRGSEKGRYGGPVTDESHTGNLYRQKFLAGYTLTYANGRVTESR